MGICPERQRLLDAYGQATDDLFQRGRALAVAARSYEGDIFQRLWDRCEAARKHCAAVRHELAAHMHEHGCEFDLFGSAATDE